MYIKACLQVDTYADTEHINYGNGMQVVQL